MSEVTPQAQAPRIAIKFGTSQPSSNGTRHTKPQPSSSLGKRQRPNALNHNSDEEEDDDTNGKHVSVTSFGVGASGETRKAKSPSTGKEPKQYVIESQSNRDWKEDAKAIRAHKIPRPNAMQSRDGHAEVEPADQDKDIKWGLSIAKRSTDEVTTAPIDPDTCGKDARIAEHTSQSSAEKTQTQFHEEDDKDAMDALLGRKPTAQTLVINGLTSNGKQMRVPESDAYKRSMQEAAEVSTIEEYGEIPEGEFGAAMLRGMGWKGEEFGTKPKEVKRRLHLMGLGSKEDEEIKKAEQAKKHGHRDRRPRLDEYRRDREKEKQERDGRYRDSYKSERDRERRDHSHDDRHRHRDRDRDYNRDRDSRRYR
ncbi:hypothetical protein F5Y16DRAFT_410087 [Xylariaceae sp. FL0255]|nr:hypothetical protein F5Y16DRAFT_410087 [Xylariaceae sp. FL0255]